MKVAPQKLPSRFPNPDSSKPWGRLYDVEIDRMMWAARRRLPGQTLQMSVHCHPDDTRQSLARALRETRKLMRQTMAEAGA